jgi:hypothetical protein
MLESCGGDRLFEHKTEPLIPRAAFLTRLGTYIGIAAGIICGSLAIGVIGYHATEGLTWIDSLLNASMILGGMGPVNQLQTVAGKLFASLYALYSGIVFLVTAGVVMAPVLHRFLHHFHIEDEDRKSREKRKS